jgi:hypothetical protein
MPTPGPHQDTFTLEIIETVVRRDQPFEAPGGGARISRSPGKGWSLVDCSRDRHTTWMRRKPATAPRRASRGGGVWRR